MVNDLLSVHFYVVFIFWMSYEYELSFFFFLVCVYSVGRRQWYPTPVLLPGKANGGRSLVGCSPRVAMSWAWLSDFIFTFTHWRRKWQPTPVFLPGESQGPWSLVGCCLSGRTESDMTEAAAATSVEYSWFSTFVKKTVLSPLN